MRHYIDGREVDPSARLPVDWRLHFVVTTYDPDVTWSSCLGPAPAPEAVDTIARAAGELMKRGEL